MLQSERPAGVALVYCCLSSSHATLKPAGHSSDERARMRGREPIIIISSISSLLWWWWLLLVLLSLCSLLLGSLHRQLSLLLLLIHLLCLFDPKDFCLWSGWNIHRLHTYMMTHESNEQTTRIIHKRLSLPRARADSLCAHSLYAHSLCPHLSFLEHPRGPPRRGGSRRRGRAPCCGQTGSTLSGPLPKVIWVLTGWGKRYALALLGSQK